MYRVLLVEDDSQIREVIGDYFKRRGSIALDLAEDGNTGLSKVLNEEYDLILLDHMMPVMDGIECFRRIRAKQGAYYNEVPIIALTANALSTAREMFMQEGFDGFIAKPIDIGEFERVMKSVLPAEMIHYEGRDAK